jgi:hypothetical protein
MLFPATIAWACDLWVCINSPSLNPIFRTLPRFLPATCSLLVSPPPVYPGSGGGCTEDHVEGSLKNFINSLCGLTWAVKVDWCGGLTVHELTGNDKHY